MKALTIWQPHVQMVVIGAKPFEFRKWKLPAELVGHRIVIHASLKVADAGEIFAMAQRLREGRRGTGYIPGLALPYLERVKAALLAKDEAEVERLLPRGVGLGTVRVGLPRRVKDIYAPEVDLDLSRDWLYGWPLEDFLPFKAPVMARGNQGLWDWTLPIEVAA